MNPDLPRGAPQRGRGVQSGEKPDITSLHEGLCSGQWGIGRFSITLVYDTRVSAPTLGDNIKRNAAGLSFET